MLLQTAKAQPATGLTQYDDEYPGNTVLDHYADPGDPNLYYNDGGYVPSGTLGAAQYTGEAVDFTAEPSFGGPWWADAGQFHVDGEQYLLLVDRSDWTRIGGTPREFMIGQFRTDGSSTDARTYYYISESGAIRASAAFSGDYGNWFGANFGDNLINITDVGETATTNILVVFFTLINQPATLNHSRAMRFGHMWEGDCRFSLMKLN